MDANSPKLDYEPSPLIRPRRSLWALASFCCPVAGLPLGIIVTKTLSDTYPQHVADRIGMLVWVAVSAFGLIAAMIALRTIRRSNGSKRGRPIAIVGVAFSVVFLAWAIVIMEVSGG